MIKADIKIGFLCNNKCKFCVQGNKRKLFGNKDKKKIINELRDARQTCLDIVFTGGEPTLHKDFFELVSAAKKMEFRVIQIQTNGRMFVYKAFCRDAVKAGANEFSPALHGHKAELHDYLTTSRGSFDETVGGIINLKRFGQRVITNTVITKSNFRNLPEIAKLLIKLDVEQFQFAFPHALGKAGENFDSVVPKISLVVPYVKKALDIGKMACKRVITEAITYCLIKGYEDCVAEKVMPSVKIYDADFIVNDFSIARKNECKAKSTKCIICKYDCICEGPWKEYPEKLGWSEFRPIKLNRSGQTL